MYANMEFGEFLNATNENKPQIDIPYLETDDLILRHRKEII